MHEEENGLHSAPTEVQPKPEGYNHIDSISDLQDEKKKKFETVDGEADKRTSRVKKLLLINMNDVKPRPVNFLWNPYIPNAKLTIIQGDPGDGKTTLMMEVMARLSRGEKLPCDDRERVPINIIYQTAEDGLEDTIKPRLLASSADCSRIQVIDETFEALTMSDERLEAAIRETSAKLVVLDPIQAYLGANVDMHRANEVRPILKSLAKLAEEYQCAIVLIGHMNKVSGGKSTYRGLGSIDFQATARSVLIVGRLKDEPNIRVVAHDKSSLAPEGKSIAFSLDKDTGFQWLGHYDISVDELLAGGPSENKSRRAEGMLMDMLKNGKVQQSVIISEATQRGISKRVLDQVKKNLGVHSSRIDNKWYWELAD